MSARPRQSPDRRIAQAVVGALATVTFVAVAFLVAEVVREFRSLNSASSDNVHWVLSQAEVEYLEFRYAIDAAEKPGAGAYALEQVVIEFDVFYSRMTTLGTGSLYEDLRQTGDFGAQVRDVRARLDAMIPLIDGPREDLAAGLSELGAAADPIRRQLRAIATTGLAYFAQSSDDSRTSVAETLFRLAALTVAMLLALLLAMGRTRRVSRQIERRGQELSDAYARLNTILETSLDAVIVSDTDGRILNFNPAAERIFQYRFDEVFGRNIGDIIIPEHLRAAHSDGMARMRETGKMNVVGHGRVRLDARRRDGEVFPVELALQKARAGKDEVVIGFLRDISQRVAAENELVDARDKALAGEKAKAEFLAMMTHEIRTPLNGLLGNLSLLGNTELDATQQAFVRNMDISGGLLMHHVDSVLDVARFEAGAAPGQEVTVHLGRLLQDIVDAQASAAEARGNSIQWGWAGVPVDWARTDATRLTQVLLNLVGNAIKFTRNGRIRIEGEAEVTGEAHWLELRVSDTGVGIPDAQLEKVFDDFHTVDDPDANGDQPGGTGLGLGIARRFVEAMGGEIGVESMAGEGSTFWLRIPLTLANAPEVSTAQGGAVTAEATEMPSRHILLVEDNEINLDLARRMLGDLGHEVSVARNGQEALACADERRFDLILMDIRMPVMDGLQATKAIRDGGGPCRDVPIVALSANVLPEARDRFLAAGMTGFLPKPVGPAELARAIASFCLNAPVQASATEAGGQSAPDTDSLVARYEAEAASIFEGFADAPEDHKRIAEDAHMLAGSAAAFGQTALREALVALEVAADQGDAQAVARRIAEARRAWQDAPPPKLN